MKRCPQCEFIYEDEQNLCDMDGAELERVRAAAPALPGAAARQARPLTARRRPWRFPALLISVGVLAAGLTSGYYVQTSQTAAVQIDHAPAAAASPQVEITQPAETRAPAPGPPPESPRTPPAPSAKTKVKPPAGYARKSAGGVARVSGPAARPPAPPAARRDEGASGPESPDGRKESKKGSKLGSALKKAGRVLKKPFGF